MRILCVDGDDDTRDLLQNLLGFSDLEAIAVTSDNLNGWLDSSRPVNSASGGFAQLNRRMAAVKRSESRRLEIAARRVEIFADG